MDNAGQRSPISAQETAALIEDICAQIGKHIIIAPQETVAVALWIMHTWVYEHFQHTPRLALTAPEKQSGKSTALEVVRRLSRAPIKTDSITASAIFRLIGERQHPTILIDEADTFLPRNDDLRGILNSGYEASGNVVRSAKVDGDFAPREFSTFCAVAVAGIGDLPSTLRDRSVPILLKRKAAHETVLKVRQNIERLEALASAIAAWASHVNLNSYLDPDVPEALNDRQGDISVPLLAIADHAGIEWADHARSALVHVFRSAVRAGSDDKGGAALLADLRAIFDDIDDDAIPSADVCKWLRGMEGRPWADYDGRNPITANQLARLLAPFGIRPENVRSGSKVLKAYHRADFADAWSRYTSPRAGSAEGTSNVAV